MAKSRKQLELNKIYCMDCLEGMKRIPDNSIDLVVTDPPYNENYKYRNSNYDDARDDYIYFLDLVLGEIKRVLKYGGSIYLKHSSKQICNILPLMNKHFIYKNLIIWISNSQAHPKDNYDSYYEVIYFYSKGKTKTFNKRAEFREKPPNYWSGEGKEFIGLLANCWYDIKKVLAGCLKKAEGGSRNNLKLHPCSMPEGLARRAIKVSSNEGDIVLDPFLGSGTTAVACKQHKRKFIGFEINPEYIKIAKARLRPYLKKTERRKNHKKQVR